MQQDLSDSGRFRHTVCIVLSPGKAYSSLKSVGALSLPANSHHNLLQAKTHEQSVKIKEKKLTKYLYTRRGGGVAADRM